MRISYSKALVWIATVALFLLGTAAYGQTLQIVNGGGAGLNVTYSNGTTTTLNESTVAGPYNMSLNSTPVEMYCDDAVDNVDWGQSWTINTPTALSTLTGNTSGNPVTSVYFTGTTSTFNIGSSDITLTQAEQYVAATYLMVEGSYAGFDSASTSLAIWDLFTPSHAGDPLVLTNTADATTYVEDAIQFAQNYSSSNGILDISGTDYTSTIYTPAGCTLQGSCNGTYNSGNSPQEFMSITRVPEPSTMALLAFDFAGAGLVGLYFLRRKSAARSKISF